MSTIPPVVKNNSHHGISTIKSDYPFKKERPGRGHYQVSLVPRDGHKGFCMYAYFNGRDWFDEHNRQLDVSRYLLSFRPWCEDYEE